MIAAIGKTVAWATTSLGKTVEGVARSIGCVG